MRLVTVAMVLCGLAGAAEAGKKVKAEVLCGVYVDGAIKDIVPSGKKPKLSDPVACALHLTVDNSDTYMGNIHTVRYTTDDKGKKKKVETSGATTNVEFGKDVELVMKPAAADENGEVLFQPCEDFDIVARVFDDRGLYFSKTIHVAQSCPKPKPMKATATCFATKEEGDRIDIPDKKAPSLEGFTVQCAVSSKDPRFFSGKLKFWGKTEYDHPTMDDTAGHTVSDPRAGNYAEGEDETVYFMKFESDDIPVCLRTFDIKLFLDDENGNRLFSKIITVKQGC
jgi:hypothetical protein